MEYEYKVIDVADGGVSTVLLGDGRIEADGWRMVFMEKVLQRYMLTSERETLMVTFERRVPEGQRQERAARVIDDVIAAEDGAKRTGRRAAAGAVGLGLGAAALGAILSSD